MPNEINRGDETGKLLREDRTVEELDQNEPLRA